MQLSWKLFDPFVYCFSDLWSWSGAVLSLFPTTEAKPSWISCLVPYELYFQCGLWEHTRFQATCEHQALFPVIFLDGSLPGHGKFPHTHVLTIPVLNIAGWPSTNVWSCLHSSFLSGTLSCKFSDSQVYLLNWVSLLGSTLLAPSSHQENPKVSWVTGRVSHLSGITVLCCLLSRVLKTSMLCGLLVGVVLFCFFACFRWEGKSSLCFSILVIDILYTVSTNFKE